MWKPQYERLKRWLSRVEKVSDPSCQMDPQDSMDFIVSFFQNCWSLKDWLMNAPEVRKDSTLLDKMKNFAERDSRYVRISQNIANGSKHLNFENYGRASGGISAKINGDGQTKVWQSASFEYTQDDVTYEVVELARNCVQEWELFLSTHGITDRA